jgi:hypothetical protein
MPAARVIPKKIKEQISSFLDIVTSVAPKACLKTSRSMSLRGAMGDEAILFQAKIASLRSQ